jgi:UDP-glucose 4-epimerase
MWEYAGDILDRAFLQGVFQRCQEEGRPLTSIIHFAALKSAPDSVRIPLEYYENNVVGSMNLVRMMELFPTCKEFIFSSSAAVYGEQDNCTEDFHCIPVSPYGETKLVVDMLLRSVARAHPDWKVISLRYFNPAGNHHAGILGDNPIGNTPGNLFSIIQEVIIGKRPHVTVFGNDYKTPDGTGVRDFVHVVDLGTF